MDLSSESPRAVLLVPGFNPNGRGYSMRQVVIGMQQTYPGSASVDADAAKVAGLPPGDRITVGGDKPRVIDMFEIWWFDDVKLLSKSKWWVRLFRGLQLCFAWLISSIRVVRQARIWTFAMIAGSLLLGFALWSTLALALKSVANLDLISHDVKASLSGTSDWMLNNVVWAWASVMLAAVNVSLDFSTDIIDVVDRYLRRQSDGDGPSIDAMLKTRVADAANRIAESGRYGSITILGHSFGALIAVDYLADSAFRGPAATLITTGGFFAFLRFQRARVIDDVMRDCAANNRVLRWKDFYSRDDFIGTKTPTVVSSSLFNTEEVRHPAGFINKMNGKTHDLYFYDPTVMRSIVQDDDAPVGASSSSTKPA
jgi:hypothetical protein